MIGFMKDKKVSRETFLKKIAFSAISALMIVSMTSCGASYTDEEVMDAVLTLVPMSIELNDIYFGEGLPISDNREDVERFYGMFESDITAVNYHPVAKDCKYQTDKENREATEAVFSDQYCEYLFELAFKGISTVFNEGTEEEHVQTAAYARYIQNGDILTVRLDLPYTAMELNRVYDFSKAVITSKKSNYAVVTVPTEKNGESLEIDLKLVLTEDGFRLDTPTY